MVENAPTFGSKNAHFSTKIVTQNQKMKIDLLKNVGITFSAINQTRIISALDAE
jgi:hypothetical protein